MCNGQMAQNLTVTECPYCWSYVHDQASQHHTRYQMMPSSIHWPWRICWGCRGLQRTQGAGIPGQGHGRYRKENFENFSNLTCGVDQDVVYTENLFDPFNKPCSHPIVVPRLVAAESWGPYDHQDANGQDLIGLWLVQPWNKNNQRHTLYIFKYLQLRRW